MANDLSTNSMAKIAEIALVIFIAMPQSSWHYVQARDPLQDKTLLERPIYGDRLCQHCLGFQAVPRMTNLCKIRWCFRPVQLRLCKALEQRPYLEEQGSSHQEVGKSSSYKVYYRDMTNDILIDPQLQQQQNSVYMS
jgi:hypothetical protein